MRQGHWTLNDRSQLPLKCPWPGVAYLKWRLKMNIYVASLADSCLAMRLIAKTRDLTTFGQISMNSLWGPPGPITIQLQEAQRSLEGEQGLLPHTAPLSSCLFLVSSSLQTGCFPHSFLHSRLEVAAPPTVATSIPGSCRGPDWVRGRFLGCPKSRWVGWGGVDLFSLPGRALSVGTLDSGPTASPGRFYPPFMDGETESW